MLSSASSIHSQVKAGHSGLRGRHATVIAGAALAFALFGASGAQAQNCTTASFGPYTVGPLGASPASVSSMVATTLAAANTAFLLQSTAFIGSPQNPAPDQQGGGVWTRAVGGEIEIKSGSSSTITSSFPAGAAASVGCSQTVHQNFAGVQVGTDIARLNSNGWNVHVGTTAGYLESRGNLKEGAFRDPISTNGGGPFDNTTKVPFFGVYAAATYGGFFIDGLVRTEYYQTNLDAPGVNLFNQNLSAHGVSFSGSIGYNWRVPNSNWFIEPSAGVILSRVAVDPFNYVTAGFAPGFPALGFSGTLTTNDITSEIGRIGLRVGTTIDSGSITWQPFASVSVWHEFGPSVTSFYQTCNASNGTPGCVFFAGGPPPFGAATFTAATATSTFGTYGQYSIGASAAVAGTGWLGFARVDYRKGDNLEGLSATGGIRYQFTPDAIAKMPVKAKAPIVEAVNWTGFYVGGFGGALLGRADWNYGTGAANPHVGGGIVGGNIGYDYQIGRWVFGVEADLGWTNMNGGAACAGLGAGIFKFFPQFGGIPEAPMFQMTCNGSAQWLATATARLGYAWERALYYVKGGGAWTNAQFSATCNAPLNPSNGNRDQECTNPVALPTNGLSATTDLAGWTVGYGIEFALTRNWSAKAEYNWVDFGRVGVTASDGSRLNVGMHFSEVKVGVNYRFGMGPVIAKY